MPSTPSTTSTSSPGTSSGGTFSPASTKRWSLELSDLTWGEVGPDDVFLRWDAGVAGMRQTHMMRFDHTTSRSPQTQAEILTRVLCHILVDRIPDLGLNEMSEALVQIYDFYSMPPSPQPRLTTGQVFQATLARSEVRPVPPLEEE